MASTWLWQDGVLVNAAMMNQQIENRLRVLEAAGLPAYGGGVTQVNGSATMPVVNHPLGVTPSCIIISWNNCMGSADGFYTRSIAKTATTFTVVVGYNGAAYTGGGLLAQFDWVAYP